MPFVEVFISPDLGDVSHASITDAVHDALVATIDVPAADRFAVVAAHAPQSMRWDRGYLDIERSDRVVFVRVTLSVGRSDDKKRALYAAITENMARIGIRREDVLIVLVENTRVDWSFGNGVAQYVPAPKLTAH